VATVCGASIASPFAAGVAALIWAGNPALSNKDVWALMNKHAIVGGPDIRRVHAYRAVRDALMSSGKNTPPWGVIAAPAAGSKLFQSPAMEFSVTDLFDVEDEAACCMVNWRINGKQVGTGKTVKVKFAGEPLGAKKIEAIVTDSGGLGRKLEVNATLSNTAPKITLVNAPSGKLSTGLPYAFTAKVEDDEISLLDPSSGDPCAKLVWIDKKTGKAPSARQGCSATFDFATAGYRIISVTYKDVYGVEAKLDIPADVVQPAAGVITVTITTPKAGQVFSPEDLVPVGWKMQGVVGDPVLEWRLRNLSGGAPRAFAPMEYFNGVLFKIGDVFPENKFSSGSLSYELELTVKSSTGQAPAKASVIISQAAFIK
jgi:hypothetical protein